MAGVTTTKKSSKGQVVIPDEIRERLGLKAGSQFVVVGDKDTVILKSISPLSMKEFDELIAEARRQARQAGMKRSDIGAAVAAAKASVRVILGTKVVISGKLRRILWKRGYLGYTIQRRLQRHGRQNIT
ncbi:MAG: AbrB/MazE/SpoVT family DNA-binding domain-containing protein [Deltaproteobacteria bacterium]|nr:AbrB/MazE/SpoVT family DNA-binding domain-containing protein [Deltaproteobacteria bacterium]